jgi:uncharacterized membrane protein YhaH (DUF805 family)
MAAGEFGSVWSWNGKVSRGTYAVVGAIGFAIKHNLDRYIGFQFGFQWGIWSYLDPLSRALQASPLTVTEKEFLGVLLLTAIPFVWIGITMTVKRLRDAGQPLWLTLVFFAPVVNLLFFTVLNVLPSEEIDTTLDPVGPGGRHISRYWPRNRGGSAALAALIAGLLGVLVAYGDLHFFGSYGLTLFIALPFVMGYLAVLLYTRTRDLYGSETDLLVVVTLSVVIAGAGILAVAIEGAICILLAAPIAWFLAMLGGAFGALVHGRSRSRVASPSTFAAMIFALPVLLGAEHFSPPPVPRFQVHTSIEIAAPPEVVWKRLIQFPALPAPKEWPFRAGVAYPIEAQLTGEGLTADRECRFSTGSFKEPILVWEPGKHFAFAVSDEPLLMKETSPYKNIHVRHLEDHDFQPERADFELVQLANGGTRLEGTTTYTNKMWPGLYWRMWTDGIVHAIHNRVFQHVKRLSEADALTSRPLPLRSM